MTRGGCQRRWFRLAGSLCIRIGFLTESDPFSSEGRFLVSVWVCVCVFFDSVPLGVWLALPVWFIVEINGAFLLVVEFTNGF